MSCSLTTFAAPLAGVKTPGSEIPIENLRRAAAILGTLRARTSTPEEDASFLASQAALAMDGAPVQLVVTAGPGNGDEASARQLRQLVEGIQKDAKESEASMAALRRAEQNMKAPLEGCEEYAKALERVHIASDSLAQKDSELESHFAAKGN